MSSSRFFCDVCQRSFASKFSLQRHEASKHPVEDSELEETDGEDTEEEEPETVGAGDHEQDAEISDSESETLLKPAPLSVTDTFINKVYDTHKDISENLVEQLIQEKGQNREEAQRSVYSKLLPSMRKTFRKNLERHFMRHAKFRQEPLYRVISSTARELRESDEKYSFTESIKAALQKRKYKLYEDYFPSDPEDGEDDYDMV